MERHGKDICNSRVLNKAYVTIVDIYRSHDTQREVTCDTCDIRLKIAKKRSCMLIPPSRNDGEGLSEEKILKKNNGKVSKQRYLVEERNMQEWWHFNDGECQNAELHGRGENTLWSFRNRVLSTFREVLRKCAMETRLMTQYCLTCFLGRRSVTQTVSYNVH